MNSALESRMRVMLVRFHSDYHHTLLARDGGINAFAFLHRRREASRPLFGTRACPVASSYSHGNAAAVPWNTLSTVKARIGERSMPPSGGMMPRNKFRYGSHSVASGT